MISKEELLRWQYDEDFQLEQIKEHGALIRYIHNPSKRLQLEAVKQSDISITFINNPSFEVCEQVLHNCNNHNLDIIIRYIDIEKYPELYEKYCFMIM